MKVIPTVSGYAHGEFRFFWEISFFRLFLRIPDLPDVQLYDLRVIQQRLGHQGDGRPVEIVVKKVHLSERVLV